MQVPQNCFHLTDIPQELLMRIVQVQEEMTNRHGVRMNPMQVLSREHGHGEVATNITEHLLLIRAG